MAGRTYYISKTSERSEQGYFIISKTSERSERGFICISKKSDRCEHGYIYIISAPVIAGIAEVNRMRQREVNERRGNAGRHNQATSKRVPFFRNASNCSSARGLLR